MNRGTKYNIYNLIENQKLKKIVVIIISLFSSFNSLFPLASFKPVLLLQIFGNLIIWLIVDFLVK